MLLPAPKIKTYGKGLRTTQNRAGEGKAPPIQPLPRLALSPHAGPLGTHTTPSNTQALCSAGAELRCYLAAGQFGAGCG